MDHKWEHRTPLARVMGVGRQQQSVVFLIAVFTLINYGKRHLQYFNRGCQNRQYEDYQYIPTWKI